MLKFVMYEREEALMCGVPKKIICVDNMFLDTTREMGFHYKHHTTTSHTLC